MDHEAHLAAVAALQAVWAGLTQEDASAEVGNTIAYASTYHSEWFWSGLGGHEIARVQTRRFGGAAAYQISD
jgi:hypothetical protein